MDMMHENARLSLADQAAIFRDHMTGLGCDEAGLAATLCVPLAEVEDWLAATAAVPGPVWVVLELLARRVAEARKRELAEAFGGDRLFARKILAWAEARRGDGFTTSEAVRHGAGCEPSPQALTIAGRALTRAGWRRVSAKRHGSVVKGWRPPLEPAAG